MKPRLSVWGEKIHWDSLLGWNAKEIEITHYWVKSCSWEIHNVCVCVCVYIYHIRVILFFVFIPVSSAYSFKYRGYCCTWSHSVTHIRSCQDSGGRRIGTKFYAPNRIRTRNSSKRAAANLRLRSRDHRHRRIMLLRWLDVDKVDMLFNMHVEKEDFVLTSGKWRKIVCLMEFYVLYESKKMKIL
jgi:hypothetical protein